MDDFSPKQPDQPNQIDGTDETQQPYQDNLETTETTVGETPVQSDETNPTAPVVMTQKKSGVKTWLLGGLVVLLLAAVGALAYWQWSEAELAKKSLRSAERQLAAAQADLANAKPDKDAQPSKATPLTEDEKIKLAASNYVCIQANAGCDKVTETVTKKQSPTIDKPGFAIVSAGDAATGAGMAIYLKSTSMGDWIVIYDGQNTPPADVVKKFAIPSTFTATQ